MQQGIVFNIQRYCVDDGPGIRTVVFLKGCPLRCRWCANPESQKAEPQVLFSADRCHDCGRCAPVCPRKGIGPCKNCGACARACWYGAKSLCGKHMQVDEVMETARRDANYYRETGGGITLSGGEPLAQPDFAAALLKQCREEGFHTAIETAGCVPWAAFERVIPHLDLVYFDVKHVDADKHRAFTMADNAPILNNLERLLARFGPVVVRIPCIPGFNASPEDLERIFCRLNELGARQVEVLPFHRFGSGKYRELGRTYAYEQTPPMRTDEIAYARELGERHGLDVCVRGRKG